ncbi:MAG: Trimethylamine methyltransferase MttB, partial [Desulfobacterales bacterium]|nr:Trimethylamine methyltransferase MttB [Desulfobacterales bacterium]
MAINYRYSNMLQAGSFGLSVLSDDDLDQIHLATLDVLWSIGIKVKSPRARAVMGDHGCVVNEKTEIVKIPGNLVEKAIQSTPATYRAHGIDPENDYVAGGKKTGFVNFGEAPSLMDPVTRKVRAATKKDVDDTVRFVDALDNIVGWERPLTPQDLDVDMASIYNCHSFFSHSHK